jgi:hypothetical protein
MFGVEAPDARSVFYVESTQINRPGPLWQLPLKGGSPVKVADDALPNSLEAVDSGIYFLDPADGTRLQFLNFATRRSSTVASKLGTVSGTIGVSRDGRTIYFSRVDSSIDDLMLVEHFR